MQASYCREWRSSVGHGAIDGEKKRTVLFTARTLTMHACSLIEYQIPESWPRRLSKHRSDESGETRRSLRPKYSCHVTAM